MIGLSHIINFFDCMAEIFFHHLFKTHKTSGIILIALSPGGRGGWIKFFHPPLKGGDVSVVLVS
jgi:hypothetical protein